MPIDIDPKVDFAFKRVFGYPGNEKLLVSLINAVVNDAIPQPITEVELLNPFDPREFETDKLGILDIKACDNMARMYNIEMQMNFVASFPQRALYYWGGMYRSQMHEGDDYSVLQPTFGIHFFNDRIYDDVEYIHRFRIRDENNPSVIFSDALQMFTIELSKFLRPIPDVETDLEQWCFLLRNPRELEPQHLPNNLKMPEVIRAVEVLTMISSDARERIMYDYRERAQRDHASWLKESREEGLRQGIKEGEAKGIVIGEAKGIKKGKVEGMLEAKYGVQGLAWFQKIVELLSEEQMEQLFTEVKVSKALSDLSHWQV